MALAATSRRQLRGHDRACSLFSNATTHHGMAALADLALGDHAASYDAGAAAKHSADLRLAQRRPLLHSGQLALHHGSDVVHNVVDHPVRPHVHACMQRQDTELLFEHQTLLRCLFAETFGSVILHQARQETEPVASKSLLPVLIKTHNILLS